MVSIPFSKYSGCGNDFVLIDNRENSFIPEPNLIRNISERRRGIGADGVILLENSELADFKMRIFNADGSEAEMCGNGVRCLMQFIQDLQLGFTRCTIETLGGKVVAHVGQRTVKVEMPQPCDLKLNKILLIGQVQISYHFVNTGVPHAVVFVEEIEDPQWMKIAPHIRHHSVFAPSGTNVNFAQVRGTTLYLRTFERGVEGETLACGTGATASALIAAQLSKLSAPIIVIPRSNDPLLVEFDPTFAKVALSGPAKKNFEGKFIIDSSLHLSLRCPF